MSEELIEETSAPIKEKRYAGFWMRFWAYIADLLIVASINGILLIPFRFINDGAPIDLAFWTVTGIVGSIVFYLYFLFMTKGFGQTLGKMIFGLKVVREDDHALGWSDLLFREVVGRFLHRVFFIGIFAYLVVAFTKEKQGIHDMIGNTRVVHVE
ncbi:RDD family protein [Aquibacillus koreensis]|uniref:RDD family protein n=1 Tax=Aquibacillus koreensis TaxID=279446 RepID=A0A9X4AIV5_9BACI|nr:RDD family protein [Aquibacillus koreensis]MCT2535282.1 RDD family protein [Aquibacillus koreensis]MDC3419785.1 RDD family protein [Aquibacillus koreensis]